MSSAKRNNEQRSPAKSPASAGDRLTPPRRPKISAATGALAALQLAKITQKIVEIKRWSEGPTREKFLRELHTEATALASAARKQRL
jgi:hypothetical protein